MVNYAFFVVAININIFEGVVGEWIYFSNRL